MYRKQEGLYTKHDDTQSAEADDLMLYDKFREQNQEKASFPDIDFKPETMVKQ